MKHADKVGVRVTFKGVLAVYSLSKSRTRLGFSGYEIGSTSPKSWAFTRTIHVILIGLLVPDRDAFSLSGS
jgi:hypothetical protein